MRTLKTIAGLGAVLGAIVLGASSASAHVTVDPGTATQGAGDQVLTFRVPNEMDNANTTQVKIQLPQDHPIAAVDVLAMPGWTTKVDTVHLAAPIQTDDGTLTDVPSVITWTGGQIKPGEYGEFRVLAMGLPDDTDSLTFKTIQGYDNNQEVSWIDATVAGQAEPEHPAPVLTLMDAAAICTVSHETFRRWVAKGVLPHVVIGPYNLKRVYRRDVDRLVREVRP